MRLHCVEHGYIDEKTGPCPYCRIKELAQQKTASEDMLVAQINSMVNQLDRAEDRAKELEQELEQYRSIAETAGASKAVSELEQATARIKELEAQLCESDTQRAIWRQDCLKLEQQLSEPRICEICKDKAVLVADKYREQNAKLVEALEFYAEKENYFLWAKGKTSVTIIEDDDGKIAAAALKEMEVQGE